MTQWHTLEPSDVFKQLQTQGKGLSTKEVRSRQHTYGKNVLPTPPPVPIYKIFLRQFKDFLIGILILAALVSFWMHEWRDGVVILVIVVLNGLLGFFQELKAEKAMEALKKIMVMSAQVIRNGQRTSVDVADLVPGDRVILEAGERVPADIYILKCNDCQVDESVLTGESQAVRKSTGVLGADTALAEHTNMLYCGTVITNGFTEGIVTATGGATEFGKIAELTGSTPEEPSPLQKQTGGLARRLGVMAILLCVVVVVLGLAQGYTLQKIFMFAISLAVSAIPEGLPAVLTITLALGMRKMLERKCLIRRMTANETLGATSVICTDKTGTLTKNEMTLTQIVLPELYLNDQPDLNVTGVGYAPEGELRLTGQEESVRARAHALLTTGALCNHAAIEHKEGRWLAVGDPTEAALIVGARKAGIETRPLHEKGHLAGELSFDSDRKRMSMAWEHDGKTLVHTKGAPEVILERCSRWQGVDTQNPLDEATRANLLAKNNALAESGRRVLAIAGRDITDQDLPSKEWEQDLTFLGFVAITDPARPEAKEAVAAAHSAGIAIAVMTGDNALTAGAVGHEIGLNFKKVITGTELETLDDAALKAVLSQRDTLFARVTPAHKMRLAKTLQSMGKICSMTGDGVNDAPALRQADVGIAMGIKGSDVAKGAADVILLDDSFASLVEGIKEGRRQFANIKKFIWYMLCSNFGEVIILSASLFLGWKVLVLLPVQILWLNLVTDGATALALGFEEPEPGIMDQPPRDPKTRLLPLNVVSVLVGIGLYKAVWIMAAFWYVWQIQGAGDAAALPLAHTVALCGMFVFSKINVFNFRSLNNPLSRIGVFSNPVLLYAIAATVLIQLAGVYVPFFQDYLGTTSLPLIYWGLLIVGAIPLLIAGEIYKKTG
jgi:Ca2+-transporting ATPase